MTSGASQRGARFSDLKHGIDWQVVITFVVRAAPPSDNSSMTEDAESDLLPWILGGALLIVAAAAIAAISYSGDSPNTILARNPPSTNTVAHPTIVVVNDPPKLPTGEVWECQNNGQRIFSDVPCDGRSTIREVSPINRMQRQPPAMDSTQSEYSRPVDIPTLASSTGFDQAQAESYCANLREEVNQIHERMRHAYPSALGDYMRGRLRAISGQQVDLHCLR